MTAPVLSDAPAPRVARLTLNRPDRMNAIDDQTRAQLHAALEEAAADPEVRVVILAGSGANFSAGGDIRFLQALEPGPFSAFHGALLDTLGTLAAYPKPLVAAVQGAVTGGAMGIALACDYVVAAEDARFIAPFMRIGLTPDMGLAYALSRRIGGQAARRFLLDDAPVEASEAHRIGLADRLVPGDALEAESLALAVRLAGLAPNALRQTRWLLARTDGDLSAYIADERIAAVSCLGGPEFREGVSAFLEKRKPAWPAQDA